ncbi:MAG: hypothetical protein EP318_11325 [Rhodobacteraceae bacterium]|nr:MAG: hypothetical protein EP318_11325 [Paracoccaceae bacterium]
MNPLLRTIVAGGCLAALVGCGGDPLAGIGRLSEVDLAEDTAIPAMTLPEDTAETPVARPGLLRQMLGGDGASARGGAGQPPSVPAGTLLSFGEVKPVCDLPEARRGKQIQAFPERRAAYRLYDSEPGRTTPHPFYITGFADGCARTFTAVVALFGAPEMHEMLRYGLPAEVQPYSAADRAYEQIKSRICRVGRAQPCGAKIAKIEKDTVFVSVYEAYGGTSRWLEMLLHAGEVMASDIKAGGGG